MTLLKLRLSKLFIFGALPLLLIVLTGATSTLANDYSAGVHVPLVHEPTGSASLQWNSSTHQLKATLTLTGLAPHSTHPAHIHAGDCKTNGAIVYKLNNVVADAAGKGTSTTVISNVSNGIPSHRSWSINIHNGPDLSPADQFTPIACGNIENVTHRDGSQSAEGALGPTGGNNQHASGDAQLTLKGQTLTVVLTAHGLVPHSAHPAHIHAGSCQSQVPGSIVHKLNNVVADGNGNATATTVIQNVSSIPDHGWYVNVHFSTDLATQTGFDSILCGNVVR
jgi:hypothetical protein